MNAPQGGRLILVVDDEAVIRALAQVILETNGYRVLCAADGPEAIDLYRQQQDNVALVLLDQRLPSMNAHATLAALRAVNPDARVVLSSGESEIKDIEPPVRGFLPK